MAAAETIPTSCVRPPGLVVHRGARTAGTDGKRLGHARRGVGGAERQDLLVGTHVLAVATGERARGEHTVGVADAEQGEGSGKETCQVVDRDRREHHIGQTGGDVADGGDAASGETHDRRHDDAADHDHQRCRDGGHEAPKGDEGDEGGDTHR